MGMGVRTLIDQSGQKKIILLLSPLENKRRDKLVKIKGKKSYSVQEGNLFLFEICQKIKKNKKLLN